MHWLCPPVSHRPATHPCSTFISLSSMRVCNCRLPSWHSNRLIARSLATHSRKVPAALMCARSAICGNWPIAFVWPGCPLRPARARFFDPEKFITGLIQESRSLCSVAFARTCAGVCFVFAHPLMDGDGRLSRFLFHKVVCGHGVLPNGPVLPVSMAMKAHFCAVLMRSTKRSTMPWT